MDQTTTLNYQPLNTVSDSGQAALLREERMRQEAEEAAMMAEEEGMDIRQQKAMARKMAVKKSAHSSSRLSPTKITSMQLLKRSWQSMLTIVGFIGGFAYLNIHAFSRMTMPDITCKFGEEWIPPAMRGISGSMGRSGSRIIGFFEVLTLILLDIAVILCLVATFGLLIMILDSIFDFFKGFFGFLMNSSAPEDYNEVIGHSMDPY